MGKLTREDVADILLDAALHGDAEAARMHGTHPRHIAAMRDASLGGPNPSGAGNVSPEFLRSRLDIRIREATQHTHLKAAEALGRLLDKDAEDSQATLAATSALKELVQIDGAYKYLDATLAEMAEKTKKLAARDTTAEEPEEPRQLEAHEDEGAET